MKIITLLLVLAITGCETANVAFNEKYDGDDFMINYEYGDGNLREDLLSKYYIVRAEEHWNGRDEIIRSGPFKDEVTCLLDLHHNYQPDDGVICAALK